jgi:DNA-binding response OmpR family regulator
MNILVVDDECEMRLLVSSLLLQEGWTVVTAENGRDALTKMQNEKFDLVISDVYMPDMDGIQLHETIRSSPDHATVPFLFVSAFDDEHTLSVLNNPSLDAFVKKGTSVGELMAQIYKLTGRVEKEDSPPEKSSS